MLTLLANRHYQDMAKWGMRGPVAVWLVGAFGLIGGAVVVCIYYRVDVGVGIGTVGAIAAAIYGGTAVWVVPDSKELEPPLGGSSKKESSALPDSSFTVTSVDKSSLPSGIYRMQEGARRDSWLNAVEDTLEQTIDDLTMIRRIVNRVGYSPGKISLPTQASSAGTYWHLVLEYVLKYGDLRKMDELLEEALQQGPSQDLRNAVQNWRNHHPQP
ncbi:MULTISPECIES: hypothetical protein [Streptacidiphilus]|uniref:DUF4239 domain-containing protein n=1 Tax=Streptacidiphilus cavernicola TaxID=3342716 RepID=A0ABV6UXI6_9ACTN|nr:hypothetical protein [Streptacidiphilus jeojiense]